MSTNASVDSSLEHSIKVRKAIRWWVDHVIGKETREKTFVKVLPEASTIDELNDSEHNSRNYTFVVSVLLIAAVGLCVLELVRILMNFRISRRRGSGKVDDYKPPRAMWMKKPSVRCIGNVKSGSEESAEPLLRKHETLASVSTMGADSTTAAAMLGERPVEEEWEPADSDAEDEVEKTRRGVTGLTPQDLYFGVYHTFYSFGCLSITGYAVLNDYLSKHFGLDYEFYVLWVIYIVVLHSICLFQVYKMALKCSEEMPSFWLSIPKSFNPSEGHLGILRDSVSSGIYVQQLFTEGEGRVGPVDVIILVLLAFVSTVCIFLPNVWIFRDVYPLRDFSEAYWPTIIQANREFSKRRKDKNESMCGWLFNGEWKKWMLQRLDESTRQHKQATSILGDLPQAVCGGMFLWRYNKKRNAYFVLLATLIALFKAILVLVMRAPTLCWMASNNVKWSHVTVGDIKQATIRFSWIVKWIRQSEACRKLLEDPETTPDAMVEAVRCIKKLHGKNAKDPKLDPGDVEDELNEARHAVLWTYTKHSDAHVRKEAEKFLNTHLSNDWKTASGHLSTLISDVAEQKCKAIKELAKNFPHYAPAYVTELYKDLSKKTTKSTVLAISRAISEANLPLHDCASMQAGEQEPNVCAEACATCGSMVRAQRECLDLFCCLCCWCPCVEDGSRSDDPKLALTDKQKEEINKAHAKAWKDKWQVRYAAAKALADLATLSLKRDTEAELKEEEGGATALEKRGAARKAIGRVAKGVVNLLGSHDREISNAALVVAVAFRQPEHIKMAVDMAMKILKGEQTGGEQTEEQPEQDEVNGASNSNSKPERHKGGGDAKMEKMYVAELLLVQLIPELPYPRDQREQLEEVAEFCFQEDKARATTSRHVLERVGGRSAELVSQVLNTRGDLDEEMKTLLKVLDIQNTFYLKMNNDWRLCRSMNLNFDPNPVGNRLLGKDLEDIGKGAGDNVFEVLARRSLAFELPSTRDNVDPSISGFVLPVFFTDLEPDDTMFIAEMWKLLREEEGEKCCEPLVIFATDITDKDGGQVYEKKLTLAALVLGHVDIKVLGPADAVLQKRDKKDVDRLDGPQKKKFERVNGARAKTIKAIRKRLIDFCGDVRFFVCAPGRGNLGDIVFGPPEDHVAASTKDYSKKQKKKELTQNKTFDVALYSGEFNIKNMEESDLEGFLALRGEEDKDKGKDKDKDKDKQKDKEAKTPPKPLRDIGKFNFWGQGDAHPDTGGLSTFALPSFAPLLASQFPELTHVWETFNNEFNRKLIGPDKLFGEALVGDRWAESRKTLEDLYKKPDITEYANHVWGDQDLWERVVPKKKLTVKNFAYNCCDAPLCDQLLFVEHWVAERQHYSLLYKNQPLDDMEPSWVQTKVGSWSFDKLSGHTRLNPGKQAPMGTQPVIQFPCHVMAIYRISEALQDYTISHLRELRQQRHCLSPAEAKSRTLGLS